MADRYWVGGSGTWNNSSTANWSATSGGAAGASAPTAADVAYFDANSGTSATVTVNATAVSLTTSVNKADINLSLSGSPTLCTSAGTLFLIEGTLTLNNNTLTCGRFSSSTATARTINFGTGNITVTGNAATVVNIGSSNPNIIGTSAFYLTYSGSTGTRTILGYLGSLNFYVTAGTDTIATGTGNSYGTLDFTGFAGTLTNTTRTLTGNLTISSGMTLTAGANATTFAATSGTQQITTSGRTLDFPLTQNSPGATLQLQDNLTMGSTRTFTLTAGTLDLTGNSGNWTFSTGIFSSTNTNTRSIAFGTGKIIVTGNSATVWGCGGIVGFSYTGTSLVDFTYSGATGTRTIAHGSGSGGTESNAINIKISAGTDTIVFGSHYKNVDFTGFSGTISNFIRSIYGNLTISTGATLSAGTSATTFAATSGTQQVTTNGKTFDFPLTFNGVGGTFAFQDALTQGSTRTFTVTNGTVQLKNGVTSTVGAFATSGTNQKFLQSTLAGSQATLSQASGTVNASYLTIRDINATGGATWNAYVDNSNIDAGNNDGWDFGISPVIGGAEYTYQLRSFTQPRRF